MEKADELLVTSNLQQVQISHMQNMFAKFMIISAIVIIFWGFPEK